MNTPAARLGLPVHEQTVDAIQLITDVDSDRSDWRFVAQARADVVPEVVHVDVPRGRPDVARVHEGNRAQVAPDGRAQFG